MGDGTLFMRARTYSTLNSRFLSKDKVQGDVATPSGWNSYTYGDNRPNVSIDPSGLLTGCEYNGYLYLEDTCGVFREAVRDYAQYELDARSAYGVNSLLYTLSMTTYTAYSVFKVGSGSFKEFSLDTGVYVAAGGSTFGDLVGASAKHRGLASVYQTWEKNKDAGVRLKDCAEFGLDLLTLFDGAKDFVGDGGLKNLKTFRGKWFTTSKGTVTGLGQKGKNAQVL